jgi:hypothetical protein
MTQQVPPKRTNRGRAYVTAMLAFSLGTVSIAACGVSPASLPVTDQTRTVERHVPGCPPTTPGTIAQANCPEILLKIVGGRMLTTGEGRSTPPDDGFALLFAADGTFLYDESQAQPLRHGAAMEVDVLTVPAVRNIDQYQWALYHQTAPGHGPFVNRLRSVQEIARTFVVPGTTPSFFVSNGAGNGGTVSNTHGSNVPLSFAANTPTPLTLLSFSTQTTESRCGQCWEVLWH